ncbi:MAG: WecB/TagA/CpsF family glycosyltransferase [Lapillicoccus sp.]
MSEAAALEIIVGAAVRRAGPALAVASANLDHIHHFGSKGASRGTAMEDTSQLRWMTLLDGAPLMARAVRVTNTSWPRLAGSDLLGPILELAALNSLRVGFLGGLPDTLVRLRSRIAAEIPTLDIRGMWSPRRDELNDPAASQRLADEVALAGVDILVVGLGKPRQEAWIQQNAEGTGARVLLAFGAAADFLAGTVDRAPEWVRRDGLEWAFRLAAEPRRLYRRYLVEGPRALRRLLAEPASSGRSERVMSTRMVTSVTAVVVTYNSAHELPQLLASLPAAAPNLDVSVIVVDNNSSDDTVAIGRAAGVRIVETGANLGFAGGINVAMRLVDPTCDAVAILNPDLVLAPLSLSRLADSLADPCVGVAVPTISDVRGVRFPSIRRTATLTSAVGDALFGSRLRRRPAAWSDTEWDDAAYDVPSDVDWASGAAWLVARDCSRLVGPWNEQYFLYSEEVEYARRVRRAGYRIRFVPTAHVTHVGGASGRSVELDTLRAVNRIRDYRADHGRVAGGAFRSVVVLHHAIRSSSPTDRAITRALTNRRGPLVCRGTVAS